MFCMKCGTKLPDHAKFCFNCGAKVPEGLGEEEAAPAAPEEPAMEMPAPALEKKPLPDIPGSHFTILGKYQVDLPRATALYNQLWAPFNREGTRIAVLARHEIDRHLKEHAVENPVEFSAQVLKYCMTVCNPLFEQAVDLLIDHHIDYVTKQDLWDRLDDSIASTDLVKAMLEDRAAIEAYEKDLAVEKMADKASWRGGGFGITGAITGTIKASLMNTAQDALSSLGRSVTGQSYSDRLEDFIRERSAKRNYPAMAYDFINEVCLSDLFAEIDRLLVAECDLPRVSFETDKAASRRQNLLARLADGKIGKAEAMSGLCSCLEVTGDTLPVYQALLALEPSAASDVFGIAAAEGAELRLAQSVWARCVSARNIPADFRYPDWKPSFLRRRMYPVCGPAMLLALLIKLRDLPQIVCGKENPHVDIALAAGTYWIPAETRDVDFWGMDEQVVLDLDHPEATAWDAQHVHFHLVKFTGAAEAWAQDTQGQSLRQGQAALLAGDNERALPAFRLAAEMGSAEGAWQAGRLQAAAGQKEDAQWSLVEAAVLGKREAGWALYQTLKANKNEQCAAYRRLAAEGGKELEAQGKYAEALDWYKKLAAEGEGAAYFHLGQMIEQGRGVDVNKAMAAACYDKAQSCGYEAAGPAIGALAFAAGQQWEAKAAAETGAQALADVQQAWQNYQRAFEENHPGAAEKIRVLGLLLGRAMEAQGEDEEAMDCYRTAMEAGSQDALLQAARLCADAHRAAFDLAGACRLYRQAVKAAETVETQAAIRAEWESRKARVPLENRIDGLVAAMEDQMAKANFYYFGEKLSMPLETAMKAYGRRAGVNPGDVVLLCDSTHSLFWGQGEEGFLITGDGRFITSLGIRVSLDELGPVKYCEEELVAIATGTVLARFKGEQEEDQKFFRLLNDLVLLPQPGK